VLAVPLTCAATEYNDAANGNWSNTNTWSPNSGYPGAGDTAIIDSHEVTADIVIDEEIALVTVVTNGSSP